jgi:hypothetical protein
MDPSEIHAKATIAAALIISHAVEIPTMPTGRPSADPAVNRLRDLTNYIYEAIFEGTIA